MSHCLFAAYDESFCKYSFVLSLIQKNWDLHAMIWHWFGVLYNLKFVKSKVGEKSNKLYEIVSLSFYSQFNESRVKVSCDFPLIDTFLYCHREVQYSGKEKSIFSAFPLSFSPHSLISFPPSGLFFRLPHFLQEIILNDDESCIVVGLLHVIPSLFLQLY